MNFPHLREIFFPAWIAKDCPPVIWNLTSYPDGASVRSPLLIPFQLLGAFIGLSSLMSVTLDLFPCTRACELHWAWSPHWNWSFLFFATMNMSSILAHNIFPPSSWAWDVSWRIDVVTTGLCALNIAVAAAAILSEYIQSEDPVSFERRPSGNEEASRISVFL